MKARYETVQPILDALSARGLPVGDGMTVLQPNGDTLFVIEFERPHRFFLMMPKDEASIERFQATYWECANNPPDAPKGVPVPVQIRTPQ